MEGRKGGRAGRQMDGHLLTGAERPLSRWVIPMLRSEGLCPLNSCCSPKPKCDGVWSHREVARVRQGHEGGGTTMGAVPSSEDTPESLLHMLRKGHTRKKAPLRARTSPHWKADPPAPWSPIPNLRPVRNTRSLFKLPSLRGRS